MIFVIIIIIISIIIIGYLIMESTKSPDETNKMYIKNKNEHNFIVSGKTLSVKDRVEIVNQIQKSRTYYNEELRRSNYESLDFKIENMLKSDGRLNKRGD